MRCVIITGLSGAGRSQALRQMEDMGYFCVDNLPPQMIATFMAMCSEQEDIDRIAIVVDTRSGVFFEHIYEALDDLKLMDVEYDLLFLETSDDVLIRRYKETRRTHPMDRVDIANGIHKERVMLSRLKDMAQNIVDTSALLPRQLADMLWGLYDMETRQGQILPVIISFGYKNGIPLDADLVFDVRFLPNPFYIPQLRLHNGLEDAVRDYVFDHEQTHTFMEQLYSMISFLLPYYQEEGKRQIVIAIGCTGGMHRSVAIAQKLFDQLSLNGIHAVIQHRDIGKDLQRH